VIQDTNNNNLGSLGVSEVVGSGVAS
jgi:hypothetical protein